MELVLTENRLEYWGNTLCRSFAQEQTVELIVPDRQPDAQRVVDVCGTVLVRSEECGANAASVAGAVAVSVLFVDAEGAVHPLQGQVPFSLRCDLTSDATERVLQARCTLGGVDARLLNSRKLLVRASVWCEMRVLTRCQTSVYDLPEPKENLQLRRKQLPLKMPLALGEKSFTLNEELMLPAGRPAVGALLKWVGHTQITEQKAVGARLIFKGEVKLHTLYEDTDGQLQSCDFSVPFSQYADLGQECGEGEAHTQLTLTALELEPDGQLECRRLLLSVGVLAQCTLLGEQTVALIEDAYCLDAALTPHFAQWSMCATLDRLSLRETALASCDTPAQSVVDSWICAEEPQRRREGERLLLDVPLHCNLLCRDAQGELFGCTLHPQITLETVLAEGGDCSVVLTSGELFTTVGANGIELRCPICAELECFAEESLQALCGGEICEEETVRRPAVILRRTDAPEELWKIAKACRSSVDAIRAANELLGETVPAETLLLIPM